MQSFLGAANFFHTHVPNYAFFLPHLFMNALLQISFGRNPHGLKTTARYSIFSKQQLNPQSHYTSPTTPCLGLYAVTHQTMLPVQFSSNSTVPRLLPSSINPSHLLQ
jgi:hypothetical protein